MLLLLLLLCLILYHRCRCEVVIVVFVCARVSGLLVYMHLFCMFACRLLPVLLSLLQVLYLYVCFISLFIVAAVVAVCIQVQGLATVSPF